VDVEEVLKANKEKEAAAKRERQRQLEEENGGSGSGGGNAMEVPKDRSSLANMRVIRRNLVYAVGLPLAIATEETLRKPEYFGQYGKISKIVINRTQAQPGTDPRRASASAYVTFAHKEDTLACILAMDGFYFENRNIRASYGTSKYCSAFIKSVRCNNPECTYLHEMGASEDTFTKQEIQAGYVTSGRDVLARQQQIVAEQLRQGSAGTIPRKRQGGGGPSGTGKAASNPVFPVPEYDEPAKPSATLVPTPAGVSRSSTTGPATLNPANIAAKLGRSSSVSAIGGKGPAVGPAKVPGIPAGGPHRKSHSGGFAAATGTTAASVVAGGRAYKPEVSESHATLTPLTPLKRATKSAGARPSPAATTQQPTSDASHEKLTPLRNGTNKKQNGLLTSSSGGLNGAPVMPSSQVLSTGVSSIGGDVIGPPLLKPRSANSSLAAIGGDPVGPSIDSLGGRPIGSNDSGDTALSRSSALGGEVFTGQIGGNAKSTIGGDKWNGGASLSTGPMLNGSSNAGLWDGGVPNASSGLSDGSVPVGGNIIGPRNAGSASPSGTSSSALASILGINLPTGSGSLNDSTSLWSAPAPTGPSPLSTLNNGAMPAGDMFGGGQGLGGSSLIGGAPIGSSTVGPPAPIGGPSNKNDIALLQSLLPGVHITSGGDSVGFGGGYGGSVQNPAAPGPHGLGPSGLNGNTIGGNWNMGVSANGTSSIGAIGQSHGPQDQRRGPGIW